MKRQYDSWADWNWPPNNKIAYNDPCGNCTTTPCCYSYKVGNYFIHCEDETDVSLLSREHKFRCINSRSSTFSSIVTIPLMIVLPSTTMGALFFFNVSPLSIGIFSAILIIYTLIVFVVFLKLRFSDPGILPVPSSLRWRSSHPIEDFKGNLKGTIPSYPEIHERFIASHGVRNSRKIHGSCKFDLSGFG